jgi:hypothetical protein
MRRDKRKLVSSYEMNAKENEIPLQALIMISINNIFSQPVNDSVIIFFILLPASCYRASINSTVMSSMKLWQAG